MKPVRKGLTALAIAAFSASSWLVGSSLVQNVRFARAEDQVQTSRDALQKAEDFSSLYRTVGHAVEPSVVNIKISRKVKTPHTNGFKFDDDTLRRFFPDRDGDGQPDV